MAIFHSSDICSGALNLPTHIIYSISLRFPGFPDSISGFVGALIVLGAVISALRSIGSWPTNAKEFYLGEDGKLSSSFIYKPNV